LIQIRKVIGENKKLISLLIKQLRIFYQL